MPNRAQVATKPAPAGLVDGIFTNFAGTLDYKLYRSPNLRKRPPLFVMLHGGSQNALDFATGTRMNELADECGGIVLYPEQSKRANALGCWNWFDTRHQCAESGEPAMIAGLTRAVIAENHCDPTRVYVGGMSAGGAMALILGKAYPDLYAAVGVHSGVPCGAANDLFSAWQTMSNGPSSRFHASREPHPVATIVFHGDRDYTVHLSNAQAIHAQALCGTVDRSGELSANGPIHLPGGRAVTRVTQPGRRGIADAELWIIHGAGHAWAGGNAAASYTDADGPNASREMLRFFLQHRLRQRGVQRRSDVTSGEPRAA
ncbi:extracellular catalytic domain type 1 short-chain-length polyhydroxyalkanoate depolymerase [Piscinibacter koreensis]|uniref:PHB depolymerase family esterase n=1 Tax=Piscinibacter koreensis TaxID=2742824 RepID=A0A7Y6TUV0_9BURK|nr:PHB depolymerase family esterase [Schlegelella koreensis]NUZ04385.1 PHB depolymerase family esterase [Schlegelella koreensis]